MSWVSDMTDEEAETLVVCYDYELPDDITDEEYDEWYETSLLWDDVRFGPVTDRVLERMPYHR